MEDGLIKTMGVIIKGVDFFTVPLKNFSKKILDKHKNKFEIIGIILFSLFIFIIGMGIFRFSMLRLITMDEYQYFTLRELTYQSYPNNINVIYVTADITLFVIFIMFIGLLFAILGICYLVLKIKLNKNRKK